MFWYTSPNIPCGSLSGNRCDRLGDAKRRCSCVMRVAGRRTSVVVNAALVIVVSGIMFCSEVILYYLQLLDSQVSVMEDELDQRGGSCPMLYDAGIKATGSSIGNRRMSSSGKSSKHAAAVGDNKKDHGNRAASEMAARVWSMEQEGPEGEGGGASSTAGPSPQDGVLAMRSRGGQGGGPGEEGGTGTGTSGEGPLLSPRGRGYLARLVLEVCSEIEDSKNKVRAPVSTCFCP